MPYEEYAPAPALRRHVACYWTATARYGTGRAVRTVPAHRVLPDGCMDILVAIDAGGGAVASVVGPMTRAFIARPSRRAAVAFVGIRFRPGEAFAFLDLPARDARDLVVSARDAGLVSVDPLLDAIATASREWPRDLEDDRPDVAPCYLRGALDAWLVPRLTRARAADARVRRAVEVLFAQGGGARVGRLAQSVGLSERQFERVFVERVGLSPKLAGRIARLQALVGRLGLAGVAPADASWSRLAGDFGFSDQAHLVRDVRALTGVTPGALVRERMSGFFNTPGETAATDMAQPRLQ